MRVQAMRKQTMRTRATALGVGVVVSLLMAACGGGGGSADAESKTLRVGDTDGTGSLNLFAGLEADYDVLAQTYPTLVEYDLDTVDPKPGFATGWERSRDGLTWTFRTRPNVKWSDGQPLTAEDAAFTYNTMIKFQKGPTASFGDYVKAIESAEAPDPNTLVLNMKAPTSTLLTNTATTVYIIPEHVWGKFATGDGKQLTTFLNEPADGRPVVSGGPFMLVEQKKDEFQRFKRNPNYFGPKVPIEGFGVKYFADDDAMVSALKTGEIDVVDDVPPAAVQGLEAAGLTIASRPGLNTDALVINPARTKRTHRELLDPKVREAFEHAVQRPEIVRVASQGYAQEGSTIIPPALGKWHDRTINALPFELDRANSLLDQAGYERGSDGIRTADGESMSYTVLLTPDFGRAFETLQADLRKIGVELSAQSLDPKALSAAIMEDDYSTFDLALTTMGTAATDPDFSLSAFTCRTRGIYNMTGYCNPAFDKLYERQRRVEGSQRIGVVNRMQDIAYRSRAFIALSYPEQIDGWSKDWTGFRQATDGVFSGLSPRPLSQVSPTE